MKKIVGILSKDEAEQLQSLSLKVETLKELFVVLAQNNVQNADANSIYQRLLDDMEQAKKAVSEWWEITYNKYHWESHPNGQWSIDFNTKEVVLIITE